MNTRYLILSFAAGSLVIAAVAYFFIALNTALSTGQMVGAGFAFFLGWAGLAYAGSSALRGMLQRSSTVKRLAALRARTFTRLFLSEKSRN
jgi:hypothetical protein